MNLSKLVAILIEVSNIKDGLLNPEVKSALRTAREVVIAVRDMNELSPDLPADDLVEAVWKAAPPKASGASFADYEGKVIRRIEQLLDVSTSDAQGMVMPFRAIVAIGLACNRPAIVTARSIISMATE